MNFVESQAVNAVLILVLAAVVFTGVAFLAGAAFFALLPEMQPWSAALIVGGVLVGLTLAAALVIRAKSRHPVQQATPKPVGSAIGPETAAMGLIANLAKEKPLLAVLFAGILGAAGTVIQHKNRVD